MFDKKEYIRLMKNISRRISNLEKRGKITVATTRFREVFGYSNLYTTKGVDEKTLKSNLQTLKYINTLKTSRVLTKQEEKEVESVSELFENDDKYKLYDFLDELSNNQLQTNYKYQLVDFVQQNYNKKIDMKEIIKKVKKEFPNVKFKRLKVANK